MACWPFCPYRFWLCELKLAPYSARPLRDAALPARPHEPPGGPGRCSAADSAARLRPHAAAGRARLTLNLLGLNLLGLNLLAWACWAPGLLGVGLGLLAGCLLRTHVV